MLPCRKLCSEEQFSLTDIEFEADPEALASILNNEGVTTELLQHNALKEVFHFCV